MLLFFFFKQKTSYDMRIRDWSSDVCASDLFFPRNEKVREECKETLERKLEELSMKQLGYRALPTVNEDLGSMALEGEPVMEQLFIQSPEIGRAACWVRVCMYVEI